MRQVTLAVGGSSMNILFPHKMNTFSTVHENYTKDIVCYMGFSMERDYYMDRKPECVNCGHYPGLWRVYEILEVRLSEFKIY